MKGPPGILLLVRAAQGPTVELGGRKAQARFNIKEEPGWRGAFTREDAPEARWRPQQRVRKINHEPGDRQPCGTKGTVLGSIFVPKLGAGYFIEWDPAPHVAVFVIAWKIEADTSKEHT